VIGYHRVTWLAKRPIFNPTFAGWKPLPLRPRQWTRRDPRRVR